MSLIYIIIEVLLYRIAIKSLARFIDEINSI